MNPLLTSLNYRFSIKVPFKIIVKNGTQIFVREFHTLIMCGAKCVFLSLVCLKSLTSIFTFTTPLKQKNTPARVHTSVQLKFCDWTLN